MVLANNIKFDIWHVDASSLEKALPLCVYLHLNTSAKYSIQHMLIKGALATVTNEMFAAQE
jgi:hypothetical protein